MPQFGGIFIPDNLLPEAKVPEPKRPGLGDILSAAAAGAYANVRYGIPYQAKVLALDTQPGDDEYYTTRLQEGRMAASRAAPASVDELLSGRVNPVRFAIENLTASLPHMVGAAAGGVVGGLTAGPGGIIPGAVLGGIPQFSSSNVARAVEEQGVLDEGAAQRAIAVAPLQSAADAAIGRFLPGVGRATSPLAQAATGGILRRTATSMVKAGATEAVTEAGQQVGERFAAGLPVADGNAAAEYVNAAVAAFAVGGLIGTTGGFRRRMPADSKPAADVTIEDLVAKGDEVLRTSMGGDQLGLNLQGGAASEQQLPLVGAEPTPPAEALPSELPQLPLDPALSTLPPDTQLELGQRFRDNLTPVDLPTQGGATVTPELEEALQGAMPPAPATLGSSPEALFGVPVGETRMPDVAGATRPFRQDAVEDIQSTLKNKQRAELHSEAQRELDLRASEARGELPLTADNFQQRVDELTSGLRANQFTKSLKAGSPEELLQTVHDQIFIHQDDRSGTVALAKKLGILTEDLKPGPAAVKLEAQRAAQAAGGGEDLSVPSGAGGAETALAPPAISTPAQTQSSGDPGIFQRSPRWAELKPGRMGPEVRALNPTSEEDLRVKVLKALATDTKTGDKGVSQIETLARKLGLVTDDDAMDITPLGRATFLSTPEGFEEVVSGATAQGYTGREASIFDRGARAYLGGAEESYDTVEDKAAYEAGRVWAQSYLETPQTQTAEQTQSFTGRIGGRRDLSPQQVQQRALNNLLEAADLSTVKDTDVASLRRMVRDGVSPTALGKALEQVQGGRALFQQPASTSSFQPAAPTRGQPRFKEMATPEQTQKGPQRVETEEAVRAYDLRNLIQLALAEKGITEARAQKLHDLLDEGKVDQVGRLLKDFDPDAKPRKRLPRPPERADDLTRSLTGDNDARFEAAVDGKSFHEVLDHMIEQAPSRYHREIARNVQKLAKALEKAGVTFDFKLVKPGDPGPAMLNSRGNGGATRISFVPPQAEVFLKSSEALGGGTNYQKALHEMVHAVTLQAVRSRQSKTSAAGTQIGDAAKDLLDLSSAVISHVLERVESGQANDFEKRLASTNAFQHADEILAWGLTNPGMQRYLNTIEYAPRQSVWAKVVELVRKLLGLEVRHDGALAELLRVSERIFTAPQAELDSMITRYSQGDAVDAPIEAAVNNGAAVNRTAQAAEDATRSLAQTLDTVVSRLKTSDATAMARRAMLAVISQNHMDREYGDILPELAQRSAIHRQRTAIRGFFDQMAVDSFRAFDRAGKEAKDWAQELMTLAQYGIDGFKTWADHTWLHSDPNAAALKQLHTRAWALKNNLQRTGHEDALAAYRGVRTLNEVERYARNAVDLFSVVSRDPELRAAVVTTDPMEAFMQRDDVSAPEAARDWWKKAMEDQLSAVDAYVQTRRGAIGSMRRTSEAEAAARRIAPIEALAHAIRESELRASQVPYFHQGRFGDHFVAFKLRKLESGAVDPKAVEHVAKVMQEKGFGDYSMTTDSLQARSMVRLEKRDQADMLRKLIFELEGEGWVSDTQGGPRTRQNNFGISGRMPDFISSLIESIENDPTFVPPESASPRQAAGMQKRKEAAIQAVVDHWIAQTADNSISRVLAKRYNVQGFDRNMMRSAAHRWHVGAIALSNKSTAPKFAQVMEAMQGRLNNALQDAGDENRYKIADLISEVRMRDAAVPVNEFADSYDKLRAYGHAYYLGFSVPYMLLNVSQVGTTSIPELAKKHGYRNSFHAVRQSMPKAFELLRLAGAEAIAAGPRHAADLAISDAVLDKSSLSTAEREFVRQMMASGTIDIGSAARSMGQIAESGGTSNTETALKYATAMGLYSETFARLATALAAHQLHDGKGRGAVDYASRVVSDSLFDFQTFNTARALGKQGVLGRVTPFVTQFMQFSMQMTEKLYSEVIDAAGRQRSGETAESAKARRAEARKFLAGHLTVVAALAGTLGLPFATVFAAVIERLVDTFDDDDEPYDATAAYRGFLADVFGKDVAEVVSRGLPRALGFDLSQRAGEQNLMPFTEFLVDKRSWKEAANANVGRGIGATPSMLVSILEGGEQFGNGEYLAGAKSILPVSLKAPIEAYRMTEDGYVDTKGNKLPLSPGAADILWQLIGFAPAEKAEYSEARGDQMVRRGELGREATLLRRQIIKAMLEGDRETAAELVSRAMEFDDDNPAFAVIPSLEGSLRRQQQARARAVALGAPLGVALKDVAGQDLTRYANVDYAQ